MSCPMRAGLFACVLLAGVATAARAASPVSIAFPGAGARLPGITSVYCIGAVPTGEVHVLTINGATTDVYRTGAFLAMVPVTEGTNVLTAVWGTNTMYLTETAAYAGAVTRAGRQATGNLQIGRASCRERV